MKKVNLIITITALLMVTMLIQSCESEGGENNTAISSYNSTKSHNMGQNCMDCHKQGGPGEGWFEVAGTVYTENQSSLYPNATVKLYTGANGTGDAKYVIEVDGKGNFYTTANIDLSSNLYPAVEGTNGTQYMSTPIASGQCNSCHGVSTSKIWTN